MSKRERMLVLSDVHSNLEALEAVLDDASKHGPFDVRLCAGDIVGYGPNPNEVVDRVRREGFISVLGNHDRAVSGGCMEHFNRDARKAVTYNARILTPKNLHFLRGLKNTPYVDPNGRFALVHGSFDGSEKGSWRFEDVYIQNIDCPEEFPLLPLASNGTPVKLGIFGHTHLPSFGYLQRVPREAQKVTFKTFRRARTFSLGRPPRVLDLETKVERIETGPFIPSVIVNFGSVGQPRHGSYAACYGIAQIEGSTITLEFRSVEYRLEDTRNKILLAGLPVRLADRLLYGE